MPEIDTSFEKLVETKLPTQYEHFTPIEVDAAFKKALKKFAQDTTGASKIMAPSRKFGVSAIRGDVSIFRVSGESSATSTYPIQKMMYPYKQVKRKSTELEPLRPLSSGDITNEPEVSVKEEMFSVASHRNSRKLSKELVISNANQHEAGGPKKIKIAKVMSPRRSTSVPIYTTAYSLPYRFPDSAFTTFRLPQGSVSPTLSRFSNSPPMIALAQSPTEFRSRSQSPGRTNGDVEGRTVVEKLADQVAETLTVRSPFAPFTVSDMDVLRDAAVRLFSYTRYCDIEGIATGPGAEDVNRKAVEYLFSPPPRNNHLAVTPYGEVRIVNVEPPVSPVEVPGRKIPRREIGLTYGSCVKCAPNGKWSGYFRTVPGHKSKGRQCCSCYAKEYRKRTVC